VQAGGFCFKRRKKTDLRLQYLPDVHCGVLRWNAARADFCLAASQLDDLYKMNLIQF
jgi:hypothetical protein